MEEILKVIEIENEDAIQASLLKFNVKNAKNFSIGEECATRKEFCSTLLSHIGNDESSTQWTPKTQALALTSLKIFAREKEGIDQLISHDGLLKIIKLAELNKAILRFLEYDSESDEVEVLVEAVKCLCNILLNNRYLAATFDQLGCLNAVTHRLSLCHVQKLPFEIVQFDLRLLFLITACGASERVRCREECNGIVTMINLIDSILFAPCGQEVEANSSNVSSGGVGQISQQRPDSSTCVQDTELQSSVLKENALSDEVNNPQMETVDDETSQTDDLLQFQAVRSKNASSRICQTLAPMRQAVYCLPSPLQEKTHTLLHDALKILFNQTLDWADKDCEGDDLVLCTHLAHLLKILFLSIPPIQASKAAMQTVVHAIEVLVNIPEKCAYCFLIPPNNHITHSLRSLHPSAFSLAGAGNSTHLYKSDFDQIFDDWNMAAIVSLVNFLDQKLSGQIERHSMSPVLTALRLLSKGHRSIRRFLKAEILPPLHEISHRPEEGDTLKSRIVRLMVAGTHGAEEVTAEFLFVLCKENANRLVKHTGYGNAAGLLLAHGLLAGGVAVEKGDYSSDSETSDTEEYEEMKKRIDPVTGGPVKEQPTSLDEMTEEEKEREAEKLEGLLRKLDEHGIIKVMPLDQHNQPIRPPEESESKPDEPN